MRTGGWARRGVGKGLRAKGFPLSLQGVLGALYPRKLYTGDGGSGILVQSHQPMEGIS